MKSIAAPVNVTIRMRPLTWGWSRIAAWTVETAGESTCGLSPAAPSDSIARSRTWGAPGGEPRSRRNAGMGSRLTAPNDGPRRQAEGRPTAWAAAGRNPRGSGAGRRRRSLRREVAGDVEQQVRRLARSRLVGEANASGTRQWSGEAVRPDIADGEVQRRGLGVVDRGL